MIRLTAGDATLASSGRAGCDRAPTVTMSAEPALDPEAIAALNSVSPDDGGAFLRELIDIFLADTPQRFNEIHVSLAQRDAPTLMRAAHSIKGAAGNFGARDLARQAQQIETYAKTADFAAAESLLPALETEYSRVKAAMESLRGS